MTTKTVYQLALNSYDGVNPQKYEIYEDYDKALELAEKYNDQMDTTYANWIVLKKQVIVKGRRK